MEPRRHPMNSERKVVYPLAAHAQRCSQDCRLKDGRQLPLYSVAS
jgi:hypothetical protein